MQSTSVLVTTNSKHTLLYCLSVVKVLFKFRHVAMRKQGFRTGNPIAKKFYVMSYEVLKIFEKFSKNE